MGPKPKQKESRVTSRGQAKKRLSVSRPVVPQQHVLPAEFQQAILNVFTQGLLVHNKHDFKPIMQEVKGHLYNRDFQAAFSKPEYLEVYALRWSAARALAYSHIFSSPNRRNLFISNSTNQEIYELQAGLATEDAASTMKTTTTTLDAQNQSTKITCIGGGAGAELVALAATSRMLNLSHTLEIHAIDVADWTDPVNRLYTALITPPPLAAHASETAKSKNQAFINPGKLVVHFHHKDILDSYSSSSGNGNTQPTTSDTADQEEQSQSEQPTLNLTTAPAPASTPTLASTAAATSAPNMQESQNITTTTTTNNITNTDDTTETTHKPTPTKPINKILTQTNILTIMFTLNELFTTSIPKTTTFLLNLTDKMKPETHLIVVDSPGSYSEIQLNNKQHTNQTKTSTSSTTTTTTSSSTDSNTPSQQTTITTTDTNNTSNKVVSTSNAGVSVNVRDNVSNQTKKYPMKWLLDHTLLEMAGQGKWIKVEGEDSVWFRMGDPGTGTGGTTTTRKKTSLNYPLELENCRYQIHVYRRI